MRIADPRSPVVKAKLVPAAPESRPPAPSAGAGEVSVTLTADTTDFDQKFRKARKRLRKLEKAAARAGVAVSTDGEMYVVTKSLDEERYTFGPLYTPDEADAHGEFARASTIQKAMWDFARSGQRTVNKQHDTSNHIGEVVEQVVWPYPVEVELQLPGRAVRKAMLPAGTAYVGVIWSPEAWPGVKGGAITGYSMGGRAMRVVTGELLPPSRR